jgi:nucleoside-diphosphate-sugar epimerase
MNENPITARAEWSEDRLKQWRASSDVQSRVPDLGVLTVPVLDAENRIQRLIHVGDETESVRDVDYQNGSVETVLVIGGAGYIGSVLVRELLDEGYTVRVLDTLIYGDHGIAELRSNDRFTFIEGDMRSIEDVVDALEGADAVVHLGALVGDPASAIDPKKTLEINYHSTKLVAEICKYHQINRFLFASTCSVYGKSTRPDGLLTEQSDLNPVSLYAKSKIESEKALLEMSEGNFSPTILRMATIYGLSPRMRFDLVVNILTAKAHHEGVIPIYGGDQYRPNVHVRDAARAYIACLEAPIQDIDGEIFNVGSNEQNYQIGEIGEIINECFPNADIDWQREKEDERSYRVDFTKIRDILNYEVQETIKSGVQEITSELEKGRFDNYESDNYNNYRTIDNIFEPR